MIKMLDTETILRQQLAIAESALQLIAMPIRVDGTYNRDRKACEILAKDAMEKIRRFEMEGCENVQSA